MTHLAQIARATIARHAMLESQTPALLMLSGGGDSVALLRLLAAGDLGAVLLRVLHVNHMLRAGATADEEFVRGLCDELGVECRVVRYDVAAYAEQERLNLEDAGRRVRYRFADEELDAWCAQLGVGRERGRIVVAHTRDDRVETFFMRAVSGSGAGALNALAPLRGRIVRPLVDCDRGDIREWLEREGWTWREDESNSDTSKTRALIRAELLPIAEKLNPSVREAVVRTMELLGDDDALLSQMAEAFTRDFAEVEPGVSVRFGRDWMRTLDRTMARRTVRTALQRGFPEASRIEFAHVEALVDGMTADGFAHDLPDGLRAVSEYDNMVILRTDAEAPRVAPSLLSLPGSSDLGAAGTITADNTTPDDTDGDPFSVVIDAGRVGGELAIDSVREGDRMRPLGMSGSKKLSDLLTDAKIPRRIRMATPVVRDGERVVWLAGVRMSDEYRVTPETTNAIRLSWSGRREGGPTDESVIDNERA